MKIIQYCQHVLGVGHFFRSLEICRALKGHQVVLVTGGTAVDTLLPHHVREFHLSELMMDCEFQHLYAGDHAKSINQIKEERQKSLFNLFERENPDLFLVELYPFGRKAFKFEIDPVLRGIRNKDLPESRVICSLRDILVEKKDPLLYETRVIDTLNRYFDALMVHSDPNLIRLDETFSRTGDIAVPVVYTGFVTPRPAAGARERLRRQLDIKENAGLVLASAGGGTVGEHLLKAVIEAFPLMRTEKPLHLFVFTGPLMSRKKFERLEALSSERVEVKRFTADFPSYLAAADLSVSMAGYNTCMNILAAAVPALVWAFPQNREQRLRADRIARTGALNVLEDRDLHPSRLAAIMDRALSEGPRPPARIDLDGAVKTADWIEKWIGCPKRLS
jgi:predicted glycosyltransferase